MIGRAMQEMTDEQLQRLADANSFEPCNACFCFIGHASGAAATEDEMLYANMSIRYLRAELRFMDLCERVAPDDPIAPASIVRAINDKARRILAARVIECARRFVDGVALVSDSDIVANG